LGFTKANGSNPIPY